MDIQQYKQMLEQPWGKIQYEITFAQLAHLKNKKILEIEKKGKLKETMQYNMQKIFHEFEEIIREYPDQYMWQHKRWRKK